MANVNKVILVGRLTQDVELRHTQSNVPVCDLDLAINRKWKDRNGAQQEDTVFVNVTFWARLAELAAEYLEKGREVYVEGRLQLDRWQDAQTGQNRQKLKVVAENMQFLGGPGGGNRGAAPSVSRPASAPSSDDIEF